MGPGRSLVQFVWRLKPGRTGRTFGCWIAGGVLGHRILPEKSQLRGPLRLPVRRRSTSHTIPLSSLLYSDKKNIIGELLTLKSGVPQAGTQRPYLRSSLLVLPSGDSSYANIRRNIGNRLCAYSSSPFSAKPGAGIVAARSGV